MSENDAAVIGIQSCGCITYANARPDRLEPEDQKAIGRIVASGGEVVRTTVAEARTRPYFLEAECPHDPKGWEPEPYVDPAERIRITRSTSGAATVYRGWKRIGSVRREQRRSGFWHATVGWFQRDGITAWDGSHDREEMAVAGPFRTRKEAVDHLVTEAQR